MSAVTAVARLPASFNRYRLLAAGCALVALLSVGTAAFANATTALAGHAFEDASTAAIWALLAWVLRRRTAHPMTRIFLIIAVGSALAVGCGVYAMEGWPAATFAAWVSSWIWVVSTFAPVTLMPACFPSGRFSQRPALTTLSLLAMGTMILGLASSDRIDLTTTHDVANPLSWQVSDGLFLAGSAGIVAVSITAIIAVWRHTIRSAPSTRRQLVPVALAVTVTLPGLLVAVALPDWSAVIQLAVAPLVPGAMILSILQFRLYDVEVAIRRSLVFLGLTILVIGGYVLVVQALSNLTHRRADDLASIAATAAIALAFTPARLFLQRRVGRWVYGDRDSPGRAVADIGGLVSGSPDATLALDSALARLREALRIPWAEVSAQNTILATAGTRPRWATDDLIASFALVHLGATQGELRIAPRTPRERPNARDRALLTQLLALVAAVLAGQRLVADLRRSRESVVLAREEERRRVRRDLHDGVGPLLSAIATHADVARLRVARAPHTVEELLQRIQQLGVDAATGLRRVVDDLTPVAFDEVDLTSALDQLTTTLSGSGVPVRLSGCAGVGLPAAVEVATYRIAAEAISNALRHGEAARVDVELTRSATALALAIRDDGHGIESTATPGVGLASMRERADDLGARLTVESSPAGTLVRAEFPLPRS